MGPGPLGARKGGGRSGGGIHSRLGLLFFLLYFPSSTDSFGLLARSGSGGGREGGKRRGEESTSRGVLCTEGGPSTCACIIHPICFHPSPPASHSSAIPVYRRDFGSGLSPQLPLDNTTQHSELTIYFCPPGSRVDYVTRIQTQGAGIRRGGARGTRREGHPGCRPPWPHGQSLINDTTYPKPTMISACLWGLARWLGAELWAARTGGPVAPRAFSVRKARKDERGSLLGCGLSLPVCLPLSRPLSLCALSFVAHARPVYNARASHVRVQYDVLPPSPLPACLAPHDHRARPHGRLDREEEKEKRLV